jgi:long-chain acyl-CoA synthetase
MSNFYTAFETAARANPERVAIEVVRAAGVDTWSYADLEKDAMRWAAWLHAQGVAAGDRCAILADNDARWIGAYLGALRLGAVAVPLDTNYKASQVRTVADNCDARVLFHTAKYAKTAAEAAPNRTRVDIYAGADARPATPPPPVAERSADDAAVMLYTSGTTSDPKGVILTHGNLAAERTAAFSTVPVTKDDAVLGVLPLFHALAQLANLLLPLAVGGRVVFLETVSSTSLLAALQERGITIFACVPQFFYLIHQRVTAEVAKKGALTRAIFNTMLRTNGWLRDHMGWNPGERWFARVHHTLGKQMRVLLTGGSKFDPVIGRALYDLGFNLQNAYGLTECTGGATIMTRGEKFNTSVGKPLTGVEIRIQKDNGPKTQDDDHADGEILIRGPVVMKGYYNRPDANAETLKDGCIPRRSKRTTGNRRSSKKSACWG